MKLRAVIVILFYETYGKGLIAGLTNLYATIQKKYLLPLFAMPKYISCPVAASRFSRLPAVGAVDGLSTATKELQIAQITGTTS